MFSSAAPVLADAMKDKENLDHARSTQKGVRCLDKLGMRVSWADGRDRARWTEQTKLERLGREDRGGADARDLSDGHAVLCC